MLVTSVSFNQTLSRLPCIVSFLLMVMTFEGMLTRRSKSFLAWIVQNLALNIISRKKLDPSCHYANSNCCWIGKTLPMTVYFIFYRILQQSFLPSSQYRLYGNSLCR